VLVLGTNTYTGMVCHINIVKKKILEFFYHLFVFALYPVGNFNEYFGEKKQPQIHWEWG